MPTSRDDDASPVDALTRNRYGPAGKPLRFRTASTPYIPVVRTPVTWLAAIRPTASINSTRASFGIALAATDTSVPFPPRQIGHSTRIASPEVNTRSNTGAITGRPASTSVAAAGRRLLSANETSGPLNSNGRVE